MKHLLTELLFPPRCISCGKLMPPALSDAPVAFCAACREKWESERICQCPHCFQELYACRCVSPLMKKAGVTAHLKLMGYGEGADHRITRNVIATVKRRGSRRAFRFLAEELKDRVQGLLSEAETQPETVIAFLPRTRHAKRQIGYDQAERLAMALSAATGIRFVPLLARQKEGLSQKLLKGQARVQNVKGAFVLRQCPIGLRVVLVDDVVTTGAGMAEAARLLRREGAAEVISVSIALTLKKSKSVQK